MYVYQKIVSKKGDETIGYKVGFIVGSIFKQCDEFYIGDYMNHELVTEVPEELKEKSSIRQRAKIFTELEARRLVNYLNGGSGAKMSGFLDKMLPMIMNIIPNVLARIGEEREEEETDPKSVN